MKVWSRGLGKVELLVDCRYYEARKDPNSANVFIIGTITDPVNWEFKATLEPEDIPGFMKLVFNWCLIKLVLKNMYRYIIYYFKRDQYRDPDYDHLEEKVTASYNRMMNGRTSPAYLQSTGSDS